MPTDDADKLAREIINELDAESLIDCGDQYESQYLSKATNIVAAHIRPLIDRAHEADSLKRTIVKQDNVIAGLVKRVESSETKI